ncbi:hypothetical protein SAMN05421733_11133 [Acinetobacter boissieri]|uniref:Uncharacterized protein n=1 Tax=Acinetobacter boissieri TaxID=1219383 RepID=A0A1G6JGM7_9GAMM|nr:hypothetical protein SAMN05421733_11133 [Acinetobacter boissieri]
MMNLITDKVLKTHTYDLYRVFKNEKILNLLKVNSSKLSKINLSPCLVIKRTAFTDKA